MNATRNVNYVATRRVRHVDERLTNPNRKPLPDCSGRGFCVSDRIPTTLSLRGLLGRGNIRKDRQNRKRAFGLVERCAASALDQNETSKPGK